MFKNNKALALNKQLDHLIQLGADKPLEANASVALKEIPTESIIELVLVTLSEVGIALTRSKGIILKIKIAYIGVKLIYDIIKLKKNENKEA